MVCTVLRRNASAFTRCLTFLVFLSSFSPFAQAQMPPGYITEPPDSYGYSQEEFSPEAAPTHVPQAATGAAALLIRIERLEGQVRSLNGQIEQLQYNQKKLEEKLTRSQQDVEERFQERAPNHPPSTAPNAHAPQSNAPGGPSAMSASTPAGKSRHDAFDPTLNPTAPGAPKDLTHAPDNASPPLPPSNRADNPLGARQIGVTAATTTRPVQPSQTAGMPQGPKIDFDLALVSFKNGQYAQAQSGFRNFVDKYPKDPQVGDAVFYLGESFEKTNQPREAAEQYLKYTNNYGKTPRAPDALYRLGMSLEKLGAKDQACSALLEVGRRYPRASSTLRGQVAKDTKRIGC